MISLTTEYALRAMIFLAQNTESGHVPGHEIATKAAVPRKYLSTILGDLVRAGILHSATGPGGGFSMARKPKEIMLYEVFAPFEPMLGTRRACPFGNEECNDADPCAGHDQWKKVNETYSKFLEKTSIYDIAFKQDKRRCSTKKRKRR